MLRLGRQRTVDRDNVGHGRHFFDRVQVADAQLRGLCGRQVQRRPGDGLHAQCRGALPDGAADGAEAEDADRAAGQAAQFAVLLLLPFPTAQIHAGVNDPPVGGDHHSDRQFGHGQGVLARTVRHVNALRTGGGQVDGIDARTGADNQRELRGGVDRLGGHLGRADHEHAHVGHGGGEVIGVQVASHLDLAAQFFQFGNGFGR